MIINLLGRKYNHCETSSQISLSFRRSFNTYLSGWKLSWKWPLRLLPPRSFSVFGVSGGIVRLWDILEWRSLLCFSLSLCVLSLLERQFRIGSGERNKCFSIFCGEERKNVKFVETKVSIAENVGICEWHFHFLIGVEIFLRLEMGPDCFH